MELEEMQATWSQMTLELENQKKLTDKLIMEMTKERFKNKIGVISKYEGMGTVICFLAAIVLISRFSELNTWYLLGSGVFTVTYLIVLPILVLRSIRNMKNIDLTNNNYSETLLEYAKRKKQFLWTQKIGIYLNFGLLVASLPVVVKVLRGKDIFVSNINLVYWYIPVMVVFLVIFSTWGYRKYKNIADSASRTLEELEAKKREQ
jgi:hypothetical protein